MNTEDKPGINGQPFKITLKDGWNSLEALQKEIEKILNDRKPDIEIFEDNKQFMVTIIGQGDENTRALKMRTGIGGLRLYLKQYDKTPEFRMLLKVSYNGIILSTEQRESLFLKLLHNI